MYKDLVGGSAHSGVAGWSCGRLMFGSGGSRARSREHRLLITVQHHDCLFSNYAIEQSKASVLPEPS